MTISPEQNTNARGGRYANGYRTPAIEDDDHPLNVWRSAQADNRTIRSYFPPQNGNVAEQFDRFHRNNDDHQSRGKHMEQDETSGTLPWKERLKHTTWAFFTLTMATGGLANVLHTIPFEADWLYYVGLIFFFLNIVLYITIWGMILTRFISHPSTFKASLIHPTESLFVPAFAVSFGTICITIVEYGANNTGQWLSKVVWVLFWFNVALAITLSITIYMILWSSLTFTIAQMTPIWIFPAYPLLIVGPHAANLADKLQSPTRTLEVIIGGFTVQGIGFLVSLTIYSAFVYRLMTQKLPADPTRPGMFVSVGPAAFTCSGTIGMTASLQRAISGSGDTFMNVPATLAAQILQLVGTWMSLWLWGLALWFFFVSVISNLAPLYTHRQQALPEGHDKHGHRITVQPNKIPFAMTWYSYIFPQTALITATFRIADAFNLYALKIIGCAMSALLTAMWFFVVTAMIRAIIHKQILWPEKGEDKEEGGYKRPLASRKSEADVEEQVNSAADGTASEDTDTTNAITNRAQRVRTSNTSERRLVNRGRGGSAENSS